MSFFDRIDLKMSKVGSFSQNDSIPTLNEGLFLEATNFLSFESGQSEFVVIPGGQNHVSGSVIRVIGGKPSSTPSKFKYRLEIPYSGIMWVACRFKRSGSAPRCFFSISTPDDPFGSMEIMPNFSNNEIWYQRRLAPSIQAEEDFYINIGYDNPGDNVVVINGSSLVGDLELDCIYFGYERLLSNNVFSSNLSGNWWTVDTESSVSPYRISLLKNRINYSYSTINLVSLGVDGSYQSGMGSWCSLDDKRADGWRQFIMYETSPNLSQGPTGESFIVPIVSPYAATSEFFWEKSLTDNILPNANIIEPDESFNLNNSYYSALAVRCYSRRNFILDGKIITPEPILQSVVVANLDDESLKQITSNTAYIDTESGVGVRLSLPQRTVGIIIDQSGSMSWNDPDNVRFSVARELINRFAGGYPGNISFAISSFSGVPINVEWFAARERDLDDAGSPQSAQASFSESGSHNFAGVQIVRKKLTPPSSPSDGDIVFDGYGSVIYDKDLDYESTYYYAIYPKDVHGRIYPPKILSVVPDGDQFPAGLKSIIGKEYKATGIKVDEDSLAVWHMNESGGYKAYSFCASAEPLTFEKNGNFYPTWLENNESPPSRPDDDYGKGSGIRLNGVSQWLSHEGAIPHDGNNLSISIWINPLRGSSGIIGGPIVAWKWGSSNFSLSAQADGKVGIEIDGIEINSSSNALLANTWNSVFVNINGLNGNISIYINNIKSSIVSLWRLIGDNLSKINVGKNAETFGAYKVTELSFHKSLFSDSFVDEHFDFINPDNGDRILVVYNPNGSLIGPSGNRLLLKYKREAGPLRLLDQNISGPANVGRYGGDSSRPQNVPIPPGLQGVARSDVSARICYGDDLGPVDPNDGTTIYDSNDGILEEVIMHGPFSLPMRVSELGTAIVYTGYRHYIRGFTVNEDSEHSLPEDSGMIEYQPSSMGDNPPISLPPDQVLDVSVVNGDKKVKLSWSLPLNSQHDTVVVYYAKVFSQDAVLNYQSLQEFMSSNIHGPVYPVFCGEKESTNFVHYYGRVSASTPIGSDAVDAAQTFTLGRDLSMELENDKIVHYAIVLRNADGKYGEPIFVEAKPDADNDNKIGTESPLAPRIYKLERGSISIKLISPVNPKLFYDVDGWLDDRVFFYFKVSDIYGRPLEDEFEFVFRTSREISSSSGDYLVPPPNLMITDSGSATSIEEGVGYYTQFDPENGSPAKLNFKFRELCRFTRRTSSDGFVKFSLDTDAFGYERLRYVGGLYFSARMSVRRKRVINSLIFETSAYQNTFTFDTQPIRVWLSNPYRIEVSSPDKTIVSCIPPADTTTINSSVTCGAGSSSDRIAGELHGAYVGRSRPLEFVFKVKYKDGFMPEGSSAVFYAFQDDLPSFTLNNFGSNCRPPVGYEGCVQFNGELGIPAETKCTGQLPGDPVRGPSFTRTYTPANYIAPRQRVVRFSNNSDTGWSEASFLFPTPSRASAATIFAETSIGGLPTAAGMYFAFPDSLFLTIDVQAPLPDGNDVARQIAYAAVIDPNRAIIIGENDGGPGGGGTSATLDQFSVPVPDGTRIDWEFIPLRNGKNRPFYSLISSNSSEVYDLTVGGYSNNVRFGPANNVTSELVQEVTYSTSANGETNSDVNIILIPEIYLIKASVTYGGKTANAWKVVCLYPPSLVSGGISGSANQLVRKTGMFSSLTNGRYSQRMYADGDDFALFQISRDARISSIDSSSVDERTMATAFMKCYNGGSFDGQGMPGAFYTTLPAEKLVEVQIAKLKDYFLQQNSPYWVFNVEIIHGNISIVTNEDGSVSVVGDNVENNNSFVRLTEQNKVYFAIRTNGFIPKVWSRHNEPTTVKDTGYLCEHFHNRPFAASGEIRGASGNESPVFSNQIVCSNDGFVESCNYDFRIINETEEKRWLDYDIVVNTQTNIDTEIGEIPCIGSGSWGSGNPPKMIKFVEPLDIVFAFNEIDGERNFDGYVLVNGTSVNILYFAVTFAGKPVPHGTPIYINVCGSSLVSVVSPPGQANVVNTFTVAENGPWCADANGNFINVGTSYAKVELSPIATGTAFESVVFVEARYNKNGSTFRQRVCGIRIVYDGSVNGAGVNFLPPPGGGEESNNQSVIPTILKDPIADRDFESIPISNQCHLFDKFENSWVQVANMAVARAWHVGEHVNGVWYVIGGISPVGITTMNEKWNALENRWDPFPSMPTARFGCSSVNDGRYIYVIGGIETYVDAYSNPAASKVNYNFRSSNKIERYDTIDGVWSVLSSMPWTDANGNIVDAPVGGFDAASSGISPLSSVFGAACLISQKIYVLCGAKSIKSDLEPQSMLNRVLIFDINTNSWSVSTILSNNELFKYARLYPNAIVKDNNIIVFGGSGYREETEEYQVGNQIVTRTLVRQFNFKDTFAIDIADLNTNSYLYDGDQLLPDVPDIRDQASQAKFGNDYIVVGGRKLKSRLNPGSPVFSGTQLLSIINNRFEVSNLADMPFGKSICSFASDNNKYGLVSGGIVSNKSAGFVRIFIDVFGEQNDTVGFTRIDLQEPVNAMARLDGISGIDIKIRCYDENGNLLSSPTKVKLTGFIKFPLADEMGDGGMLGSLLGRPGPGGDARFMRKRVRRGTKVFPVRIEPELVDINNGIGESRLKGRSEDPLRDLAEVSAALGDILGSEISLAGDIPNQVSIRQGLSRFPYQIVLYGEIVDDVLYGNTTFVGSDNDVSDVASDPALSAQDQIANQGNFDFASPMPEFTVGYGGRDASNIDIVPLPFINMGSVLESSKLGVIGPIGDSDIFTFVAPIAGDYVVAVTNRGISALKSQITIYNENRVPLDGVEVPNGNILFYSNNGIGDPSNIITLQAGSRYYIVVKAIETSTNPPSESMPNVVGEYRLRLAVPFETSNNLVFNQNINGENLNNSFVGVQSINPPTCPYECPSCLRTGAGLSGLTCTGSNNTVCVNLVGRSTSNFNINNNNQNNFNLTGNGGGNGEFLGEPQPPTGQPELLDFVFVDMDVLYSYWSGGVVSLSEPESPIIQYYSDLSWLPQVRTRIFYGSNAYFDAQNELDILSKMTPFGCSPVFDAIRENAFSLPDVINSESTRRSFIIISDNDENASSVGKDDVAADLNSLRGARKSPLMSGLLSLVEPRFVSSSLSRANAGEVLVCSTLSGGGTTVIRELSDASKFVNFAMSRSLGSLASGVYEALIDLGRSCVVASINPEFDIPDGASASYSAEFSIDNNEFLNMRSATGGSSINGPAELIRYVKFKASLSHSLINVQMGQDGVPEPNYPALLKISMLVSFASDSTIVTKEIGVGGSPNQVVLSVLAEKNSNLASIECTASSSIGYDFADYAIKDHSIVEEYGKIIFSQRKFDTPEVLRDVLIQKIGLYYESPRGGWSIDSQLTVKDGAGEIIDSSMYIAIYNKGAIVFKSYFKGPFTIEVKNKPKLSVATNIINASTSEPVEISGISYMVTTEEGVSGNVANQPPIAVNLSIPTIPITIYEKVSCNYVYVDSEGDSEDTEKTQIRWFINDAEIPFLRNKKNFNDYTNPFDPVFLFSSSTNYAQRGIDLSQPGALLAALDNYSFIKVNDRIKFSIKPHDQSQYGAEAYSQQYTVISVEVAPAGATLKARLIETFEVVETASNLTFLFIDFPLFAPNLMNIATVRWYVTPPDSEEVRIRDVPLISSDPTNQSTVLRGGIVNGVRAIAIGNIIRAEIFVPATTETPQYLIATNSMTIRNVRPFVELLIFGYEGVGEEVTQGNFWLAACRYAFNDADITAGVAQEDLSVAYWEVKYPNTEEFVRVEGLDPRFDTWNVVDVPCGSYIRVSVLPYDGIDYGTITYSNTILKTNSFDGNAGGGGQCT